VILAVARNRLWSLRRDRAALVLSFVVPIVFFSVFAAVFGGSTERATTRKVRVALADEDRSEASRRFVGGLKREPGLEVMGAHTAATAEAAVKAGDFPVALVILKGFGETPIRFGPSASRPGLVVLCDPSDPIAPEVLSGLVQKVVMTSMPDAMAQSGMDALDKWGRGLTAEQRAKMAENLRWLRERGGISAIRTGGGLVEVQRRDVLGGGKKERSPMIAFYAAGLGVMFLLFSAAGAGGALIEEAESGTLDRVLSTQVTMTHLLLGKLVYLAGLAASQLTVMFLWGSLCFGLRMRGHWAGFCVMTIATALSASTFGLLLAAVSRSRMQLVALSNLSVLVMSAVGGSMFPRFLMPEAMQRIGLVTLNAWAIDGFQKVFWREEPLVRLWPQVLVLCALASVFFAAARRVARRWETA
jgi:linearmycin/streptolysin S transport system permease protein